MEYSTFVEPPSNTPLFTKLGIAAGTHLVVLHAPKDFTIELPVDVSVGRRVCTHADVVVSFYTRKESLAREIERLSRMIYPSGGLWIAWPKKSSGVSTTLNDHVVRELALPLGLVDNKVCAIDSTWTGLRVVWRTSMRHAND